MEAAGRIRVWDWPTRIVHWLLVLLIPLLWWTAEEEMMERHMTLGQLVLGLLIFRLAWGLIGSSTARFSSFVRGPRAIADYLAGRSAYRIGHSPLGALSVLAMLFFLGLQVGLGLLAGDEDGYESGPLSHLVSADLAEEIADLHGANFNILLALIALHVAAIFFYLFVKRDNLLSPMVVGTRDAPDGVEAMQPAGLVRFLIAVAIAVAATLLIAGVI